MAHAVNLAKGASSPMRIEKSQCLFCATPETQQHVNAACTHPPLVEIRRIHRRRIDEYLQCYRHHHLHARARWIIPIIDYMEDHMWTDTEVGGYIWNGRWSPDLLTSLLGEAAQDTVDQCLFKWALQRLQKITQLLQTAQRAIYRVRYVELSSKEAKMRRDTVIALRRKRTERPTRTLFASWNIPYTRPDIPKRKLRPLPLPPVALLLPQQTLLAPLGAWKQYAKPWSTATSRAHAPPHRRLKKKVSERDEHRTSKFKLRKLLNILRLCR
jgi:hypothetical protein